jgi:hypothetical protein
MFQGLDPATGEQRCAPLLRADPRSKLAAGPLLAALEARAAAPPRPRSTPPAPPSTPSPPAPSAPPWPRLPTRSSTARSDPGTIEPIVELGMLRKG